MDKVRVIANVLWTQRFWVLSGICAIVAAVCWNMASSEISAEFTKRKGVIEGTFRDVTTIRGEAVHPNDNVNAGDLEQAKLQRNFVQAVWEDLYQRQRREVLFWPKSLGEDFVTKIEGKKFGGKISSIMRDRYLNYIETRFDALLEIVDAKKMTERGSARGGGGEYGGGYGGESSSEYGAGAYGDEADEEEEDYLVQWLDQEELQKKLFFESKPTAMQVWVTQEDLWVYETLLNVIAKTNKARGATRPDNTAVRVIVALKVGRDAIAKGNSVGKVYIPLAEGGAPGGYDGGGYDGGGYDGGGYEEEGYDGDGYDGGGGYAGGRAESGNSELLQNRYLDAEGKPDPAESDTIGTTEFRKLPIHMTLMMDQRYIPQLLIEFANAALPVEVKQLRINPSKSRLGVGKKNSGSNRSTSQYLKGVVPDANLAEVEIRGTVYVYNEPDSEALKIPGVEEEQLADDSI